jgi:hypothetical protein
VDYRAAAQRLLHHRVQELVAGRVANVGGGHRAAQQLRVAHQPLRRPGQRGRGGFVAGHQQRHQLVAQLDVRHPAAVPFAHADQHGQHVGPLGEVRIGAPAGDLGVEQRVRLGPLAPHPAPRPVPQQFRTGHRGHVEQVHVGDLRQHFAQRGEPFRVVGADHRAQDDLQGDRGHPWRHRELPADRPAGHVGGRDPRHQLGLPVHRVPVERRQHQLAAVPVPLLVEQQHRAVPEHAAHDRVGLAGVVDGRVAGEHRLTSSGSAR